MMEGNQSKEGSIPEVVQTVLEEFLGVFDEPKKLPPKRGFEHYSPISRHETDIYETILIPSSHMEAMEN